MLHARSTACCCTANIYYHYRRHQHLGRGCSQRIPPYWRAGARNRFPVNLPEWFWCVLGTCVRVDLTNLVYFKFYFLQKYENQLFNKLYKINIIPKIVPATLCLLVAEEEAVPSRPKSSRGKVTHARARSTSNEQRPSLPSWCMIISSWLKWMIYALAECSRLNLAPGRFVSITQLPSARTAKELMSSARWSSLDCRINLSYFMAKSTGEQNIALITMQFALVYQWRYASVDEHNN